MERSGRLFEIIQLLRGATKPMTAQLLATTVGVTKRTIYRDIVILQSMRVPIEGEAGVGYVMRPGYSLPPLMFTDDEIEAISVALTLLSRIGDQGLVNSANRVSEKIASVLPDREEKHIALDHLKVSNWNTVPRSKIDLKIVRQAIRKQRKLAVEYNDAEGIKTSRIVWPLALVYYIDNIMLAAWCELRNDFRHFRMERFESCTALSEAFNGAHVLRLRWEKGRELFSPLDNL